MRYTLALEWSCDRKVTLWPNHDPIKAPTPVCCFAGWTCFKSIEVTLRNGRPSAVLRTPRRVRSVPQQGGMRVQDLANEFDHVLWNKWWSYCPNSAVLRDLWRDAIIGRVEAQVPLQFS